MIEDFIIMFICAGYPLSILLQLLYTEMFILDGPIGLFGHIIVYFLDNYVPGNCKVFDALHDICFLFPILNTSVLVILVLIIPVDLLFFVFELILNMFKND